MFLFAISRKIVLCIKAWFFPAFWPWYGFSVLVVSYYRIVTALESRAAPRSLLFYYLHNADLARGKPMNFKAKFY